MVLSLNLNEIIKAVGAVAAVIPENGGMEIKDISTDSRKILPQSLFFAIKGENADGHDFVAKAVANGALGAVVNKRNMDGLNSIGGDAVIIAVEDTVQAFLDTAKYYKSLLKKLGVTVAVTGSVGKTTSKEFIYSVLAEKFRTRKSEGNFNTEIGLPYTLFSFGGETEAAVLEMGMSGFGEIKRLSETANPDTAVITNIGTSHIETLGSREGIKKAKFEILCGMDGGANIILNADDPLLFSKKNKTGRKEYFFGINNGESDFTAENIEFDYGKNCSVFTVNGEGTFRIPAVGIHNVYNALPALIAGKIYGLSDIKIQAGFNNFKNARMRQNIYKISGITIIDDCYNASAESVRAALGVLSGMAAEENGRTIAVLSDVLESGEYSAQIHAGIGKAAAEKNIDMLYLFGEKSKITYESVKGSGTACTYFENKSDIARALYEEAKAGDVILFKASRGMALETVIEDFREQIRINT